MLDQCNLVVLHSPPRELLPASTSSHVILYKHVNQILCWSLNSSHLNPPVVQQRRRYFKHDAYMIHACYPVTVLCTLLYACRDYILIPWLNPLCAGLYQCLPPDSREFEDLVKIVSSCYLDSSSRGSFSYCKARLIHNELLEKEVGCEHVQPCMFAFVPFRRLSLMCCWIDFVCQFIEKRREMKQEGRTEQELAESFCFLFPDKSKVIMMDDLLWSLFYSPFV